MMNTPISSNGQLARYFLAGPLVVLAALGYSAAHAREAGPAGSAAVFTADKSLTTSTQAARTIKLLAPALTTEASKSVGSAALPTPRTTHTTTAAGSQKLASNRLATSSTLISADIPRLYYLDGQVITEAQFRALQPADIASIQVLKGEPARQLAGDKGSNGVAVITTKANENIPSVIAFNQRMQRRAPLHSEAATGGELPANMVYYVDGQQVDKATMDEIAPANMMESINVLKVDQARQLLAIDAPTMIVTTKANAHSPAVLAFNEKAFPAYNFTQEPVQVNVLVPKALAYITSHYPDARLGGEVTKLTDKETGSVKYRVQLVKGRRPFDVYFSPQGDFLGE